MLGCYGGVEEYMQDILKMEPLLQSMKPACAGMRRLSRMALESQNCLPVQAGGLKNGWS
jgi:hypothetical protein